MQKGMPYPWLTCFRLSAAIALPALTLWCLAPKASAAEGTHQADPAVAPLLTPEAAEATLAPLAIASELPTRANIPGPTLAPPAFEALFSQAEEPATEEPAAPPPADEAAPGEVFSPLPASPEEAAPEPAAPEPAAIEEAAPPAGSAVPIPEERVIDALQYLDPDPNPLLIQTEPAEVEIVGTQPLSLEEAIELAYRNNPDLQVALLELEQSQAALREAQADNFPTVSVNGTLQGQNTTTGGSELVQTPGGGLAFESNSQEELGIGLTAQAEVVYNL
ncbi:MAG TPA: TolC family protein, partial [Candidatus Obscuribacterales bacterium]